MNRFGFTAVLTANTEKHVRILVVSEYRKIREE